MMATAMAGDVDTTSQPRASKQRKGREINFDQGKNNGQDREQDDQSNLGKQ